MGEGVLPAQDAGQGDDLGRQRRRLVDAVIELIISQGIDSTTTSEIARKAGVSKSSIHYYFRDKADLYRSALERVLDSSLRALKRGLHPEDPVERQLRHIIYSSIPITETGIQHTKLWFSIMAPAFVEPGLMEIQRNYKRTWCEAIRECIVRLQERGELSVDEDPDAVTAAVVYFGDGLALNLVTRKFEETGGFVSEIQYFIQRILRRPGTSRDTVG